MMVTLHKHCSFDIVDTSYSSLIDSNTSRRPPLLIMMLSTYYLSKQLIDLHVSIYKAAPLQILRIRSEWQHHKQYQVLNTQSVCRINSKEQLIYEYSHRYDHVAEHRPWGIT